MRAGSAPLSVNEHRWAQTRTDNSAPRLGASFKTAAAIRNVTLVCSPGAPSRPGRRLSGHRSSSTGSHGMQGALQAGTFHGGRSQGIHMRPQAMKDFVINVSYAFEFPPFCPAQLQHCASPGFRSPSASLICHCIVFRYPTDVFFVLLSIYSYILSVITFSKIVLRFPADVRLLCLGADIMTIAV